MEPIQDDIETGDMEAFFARNGLSVLDLFSGLGGWSQAFRERGHSVVTVDYEERFDPDVLANVLDLSDDLNWLLNWSGGGKFDIILASPPCEKFSVMAFGANWLPGYEPKHDGTRLAMELVRKTVRIIGETKPSFWVVENPMGMLRKLDLLPYERTSVTYCAYGARVRKETDLWGGFPPSLSLEPTCRNGDPCHVPAPRGSRTGTQGPESSAERAKVPHDLALAVCLAAERDLAAGKRAADYSGRLFA
jgi:hypothetical protein